MSQLAHHEQQALIDACASEPIHIPAAIQPVGALLAFNAGLTQLLQASTNASDMLHCSDPFHTPAVNLLGSEVISLIQQELPATGRYLTENKHYYFYCYVSGPYWVIELEPKKEHLPVTTERSMLRDAFRRLRQCARVSRLQQQLTDEFRQLSGLERVMIYRFDELWNGKVIAESIGDRLDSMLGQQFPASDIPPQARDMYYKAPLRMIFSANAEPVPMAANPQSGDQEPVDMSYGYLRAVSPVHLAYMKNMGVAASCSIGLFREGELWGLLACHHPSPIELNTALRSMLLRVADYASQRLALLEAYSVQNYQRQVHEARDQLARSAQQSDTVTALIRQHGREWLDLLRACGVVYKKASERTYYGIVPTRDEVDQLETWLNEHIAGEPYWSTSNLQQATGLEFKPNDLSLAGILAVPLQFSSATRSWLIFFRQEQIKVHNWAGRPGKETYQTKQGTMLGPRTSFAIWQERVRGESEAWWSAQRYAARDIARDLIIVADGLQLKHLNEELAHMNDRLTFLAEKDDLTGIWNRRVTEQRLKEAHEKAKRYDRPYALLLMDLDKFKNINDKYGHNKGDLVLEQVAATINGIVRETDTFGRWGGEEFVIVAPETNDEAGLELAERVRVAVADTPIAGLPQITISIGVATYEGEERWDDLVEQADRAMYQAKSMGRNRVCLVSVHDKDQ